MLGSMEQEETRTRQLGLRVVAALGGAAVLVTLAFALAGDDAGKLRMELAKTLLDIGVVTLTVGLVKWLFDQHREQTKREAQAAKEQTDQERVELEFRASVTQALGEQHGELYALRRQLKIGLGDPKCVGESLERLMRVRSELGNVGHHLRSKGLLDRQEQVVYHVREARKYLEQVINELVEACRTNVPLEGEALAGFLGLGQGTLDTAAYDIGFKAHYLAAKLAADPSWMMSDEQKQTILPAHDKWERRQTGS